MIEVRKSCVHGRGVFATRRLNPGTIVEDAPTIPAYAPPWSFMERGPRYVLVLGKTSLLNSGDPNVRVEFRGETARLVVTRRVEAGEELLLDYHFEEVARVR